MGRAAGDAADDGADVDDLGSHWRGGWAGSPEEQFTHFMREAKPALGRLAWLLTGDQHRSEELVQQTLVRTFAAWPRARAGDPMAYARRVLVNARTDTWRKERREVLVEPGGHDGVPATTRTWHPPSHTNELADRDALVRALRRLTPRRRRVVVLRYLLDLPEQDVADDLDISVGTVKSTAARGLAQLRGLLQAAPDLPVAPTATHPEASR